MHGMYSSWQFVDCLAGLQIDVYTPFSALLQHLWQLWELIMLAEPLLVLAPSPGATYALS